MGGRHVTAAYAIWSRHLPDRAMRLLAFMASVTRDDDDPPRCWAGRDALAFGLGREPNRAAYKAVSETVGELRRAGAVVLAVPAAPGRQAEYHLRLRLGTVHGDRDPSDPSDGGTVHGEPDIRITVSRTTVHGEPDNGARSPCTRGERNLRTTRGGETRSPQATTSPVDAAGDEPRCIHRRRYAKDGAALCGQCPDRGAGAA